jgi:hypothetical protein
MVCFCAYVGWNNARVGWSALMERRAFINRINSFPEANTEELHCLNDVCAICHGEMENAKITPCNHLFHGGCLRRWLYVHNDCPFCCAIFGEVQVETPMN